MEFRCCLWIRMKWFLKMKGYPRYRVLMRGCVLTLGIRSSRQSIDLITHCIALHSDGVCFRREISCIYFYPTFFWSVYENKKVHISIHPRLSRISSACLRVFLTSLLFPFQNQVDLKLHLCLLLPLRYYHPIKSTLSLGGVIADPNY